MESTIVDANKVFAAFIAKGIVHDLLFSGKFKPVGPEKLLEEVEKHKDEIAEKAKKKLEDIELAIKLLEPDFKIFSRPEYTVKLSEGLKLAPHPKDVEYFALALRFDFPIWSNEKTFKKQSKVKVFSTSDLISFLSETRP
ncbi:MAG: PIN domain-containing protein [Euryarchaeota archaeon]|nr:PIN domain-containing protein [Euryarchaeota archaeon]